MPSEMQQLVQPDPQPLDPDSDHGRELAARLSQVLAEIFLELDAKRGLETAAEQHKPAA